MLPQSQQGRNCASSRDDADQLPFIHVIARTLYATKQGLLIQEELRRLDKSFVFKAVSAQASTGALVGAGIAACSTACILIWSRFFSFGNLRFTAIL